MWLSMCRFGALFLNTSAKFDPDQTVPFIVPLLGHGSIAYQSTSAETETTVQNAIRFLEMRVLEKTASRQLEIVSYDPLLENAESPFAGINKEDEGTSPVRYVQSSAQLNNLLDELVERNTRIHNECLSEGGNIIDHYQNCWNAYRALFSLLFFIIILSRFLLFSTSKSCL